MIFSNSFAQPTFPPVIYPLSIIASFLLHLLLHKLCFSLSALIWPQYFLIAKYDDEPSTMKHEERVAGVETVGCRSRTDQMEWTSRLVSNFHATVVFLWGMYIFWTTPEFYIEHSFITGDGASFHSALLYCFSNGYFLLDLYMALRYMNDKSSIVHHVVIAFNQLVILFYWKAFIMGISISVTEATTVFVNQRWFFAKSGVYDWRYRLNGVIMFFGFLIFRVTYSGYIIFVTYTNMSGMLCFLSFFAIFGGDLKHTHTNGWVHFASVCLSVCLFLSV